MNAGGSDYFGRAERLRTVIRATGLLALLVAEVVALTIRFDTVSLENTTGWWGALLRQSSGIVRIGIAVAAAVCLLGAVQVRESLTELSAVLRKPCPRRPAYLSAHLGCFGVFVWLTAFVFESDHSSVWEPWIFVGWVALGVATVVTWGATLVPPAIWLPLLRKRFAVVLGGAAIGVIAWIVGNATLRLWIPLGNWTFAAASALLHLLTADVVCDWKDSVLGTSSFSVRIAPQCSGYEGIGLIWIFLSGYLWFCRKRLRFPNAFALLPLGTVVMWAANVLRIVGLIAVGAWVSSDIAMGGFHSQAGWLIFNAVALGLVALTCRLRFFASDVGGSPAIAAPNPAAKYLVPFLAILATTMLTTAVQGSGGFDPLYPLRVVAAVIALGYFWKSYASMTWSWNWQSVGIGVVAAIAWLLLANVVGNPSSKDAVSSFLCGMETLPVPIAVGWFFFRIAGYVVTAPVAEELAFRGFLARRLISADVNAVPLGRFSWFSFLASSFLFGLLHGQYWLGGSVAGALFAVALYRRGRVGDAVIAHGSANAVIALFAAVTGNWQLWS